MPEPPRKGLAGPVTGTSQPLAHDSVLPDTSQQPLHPTHTNFVQQPTQSQSPTSEPNTMSPPGPAFLPPGRMWTTLDDLHLARKYHARASWKEIHDEFSHFGPQSARFRVNLPTWRAIHLKDLTKTIADQSESHAARVDSLASSLAGGTAPQSSDQATACQREPDMDEDLQDILKNHSEMDFEWLVE